MILKLFSISFIAFVILTITTITTSCSSLDGENKKTEEDKKADIFYAQGTQELIGKNYTSALDYLLQAYNFKPNDSKINNNLAMAYYFKGKEDLALKHLQKSIDLDSKNSDARCNLASMYVDMKKYTLAEKEYQIVLNDLTYQYQYRIYYNIGIIKLRQGRFEEAKKYFEMSVKENKEYCPANFALGNLAYNQDNLKEAYSNFKAATKGICYNEPAPHYYIGKILFHWKKYAQAKEVFKEIINRFPKNEFAELSHRELKRPDLKNSQQSYDEIIPPSLNKKPKNVNSAKNDNYKINNNINSGLNIIKNGDKEEIIEEKSIESNEINDLDIRNDNDRNIFDNSNNVDNSDIDNTSYNVQSF